LRGQEAGLPEHAVLTVGRGIADPAAGPSAAAQVPPPKLVKGLIGRRREGERVLPGLRAEFAVPVAGRVDLHRRSARVEHRRDRRGDPGPVHPVE
jgi:hypothetical protein